MGKTLRYDRSVPGQGGAAQRGVDFDCLRHERLSRVQEKMRSNDVDALILTELPHIRYSTGIGVMAVWAEMNLWRYVLIPANGGPVVFAYERERYLIEDLWPDVRLASYWQARFAAGEPESLALSWSNQICEVLTDWGVRTGRVGVDRLDYFGFSALQEQGLRLTDADTVMQEARLVKTPNEIELLRQSCSVGEAALHAVESSIRPGVTENELFGTFLKGAADLGGEYCFTRLLASGHRTNPWYQEASSKVVRPGDLVAMDTDLVGPHGYVCDFSRTFRCGRGPSSAQRDAYRAAYDFVSETCALLQPGLSYRELAEKVPTYPERYAAQRYTVIIHGVGLEDEPPFVPFIDDPAGLMPEGELLENMVVSVEGYAGEVGGQDGVKLEDTVWITPSGPRVISQYPFDDSFLR